MSEAVGREQHHLSNSQPDQESSLNHHHQGNAVSDQVSASAQNSPECTTSQPSEDRRAYPATTSIKREPGDMADPQLKREPGHTADPQLKREPGHTADPQLKREPGHTADPQLKQEPGHTADPQLKREPGHTADPQLKREPGHTADPQLKREPGHTADPQLKREPGHTADPQLALERRRSASMMEVKEHAHSRLRDELLRAQKELKLKDEECRKLSRIQEQMGQELEELTASLFEEANNMVQEANVKRMQSEKLLTESNAKIEVLQAEVTALKTLVITSTPAMPNKHLHPQLDTKKTEFVKGHRRSTSHHNLNKDIQLVEVAVTPEQTPVPDVTEPAEIDPLFYEEFSRWRQAPKLTTESAFLNRLIKEDIEPCLNFRNSALSKSAFECVLKNTLSIEPVPDKGVFESRACTSRKASLPVLPDAALARQCALTESTCLCKFRIKLDESDQWLTISQHARNRIAAVCDFLTYVRYIIAGLVKSHEKGMYFEVIRLRKRMALAKLGVFS